MSVTPPAAPNPGPFDPDRLLPEAPDPWQSSAVPAVRPGPPFLMTEMIAAEPALAERILGRLSGPSSSAARLASEIADAARTGRPIVVTGCGTSEHAALAIVEIIRAALGDAGLPVAPGNPVALQAFEASFDAPRGGLLVGVSHEGGTAATNAALAAARDGEARTALITASDRSPGAALADIVVATGEMDQSWCHTIGYVSPIVAAAAVAGHLTGREPDARLVRGLLAAGLAEGPVEAAEQIAASLAGCRTILTVASGADRPAARELVLKLEEGTWIPSAMRDLETFLHGHIPATGPETGLVLVLADRARRDERLARATGALEAARIVGIRVAAILSADAAARLPDDLTPAGRIVVPEAPELPAPVAALLGTATSLQLLTERLARTVGTNPDPIRRDQDRYRLAADAAG